jgi:hypothetical protein
MRRFLSCLPLLVFFITVSSCRLALSVERSVDYSVFPVDGNLEIYDFPVIFKNFWSAMNHNYVYWDRDPTDWDAIYDIYKPKFDLLGRVTATVEYPSVWANPEFIGGTLTAAFPPIFVPGPSPGKLALALSYFEEMTKDFIDGHLQLQINQNATLFSGVLASIHPPAFDNVYLGYDFIYPVMTRYLKRREAQRLLNEPYRGMLFRFSNWEVSDLSTLTSPGDINKQYDYITGTISNYFDTSVPLDSDHFFQDPAPLYEIMPHIATGHILISGGGYALYLSSAYVTLYMCMQQYAGVYGTTINKVIQTFFDDLKDSNLQGVIFDLRGVKGGDMRDVSFVMSRFINAPLTIAHQRGKSGEGRLDYGPWVPLNIMPAPPTERTLEDKIGKIPIIALTDELTLSGAEFELMAIQAMPNGYTIGERTYGGTSAPHFNQKFAGGNFAASPLFVTFVTASSLQTRHSNGNVYEGIGIPPDASRRGMYVEQDWLKFLHSSQTARRDNVLEAAIRHIDPSWAP